MANRSISLQLFVVAALSTAFLQITLGNAIAQRLALEERFNDPELLLIRMTDETNAGNITTASVNRLQAMSGVIDVIGITATADVRPSVLARTGIPVPSRGFAGDWDENFELLLGRYPSNITEAVAPREVAAQLGLGDGVGTVTSADSSINLTVVGLVRPRTAAARSTAAVLHPVDADEATTLRSALISVDDVDQLEPIANMSSTVAAVHDRAAVSVSFADEVAELRSGVNDTSGRHAATFVTIALLTSAAGVVLVTFMFSTTRRREFGRRRALGATRVVLVVLVLCQVLIPCSVGAMGGAAVGAAVALVRTGSAVPWGFVVLSAAVNSYVSLCAGLPAALASGLRDPVRVLRQP